MTAATESRGPLLGAFAGYNVQVGRVQEISADWDVPRIDAASADGQGSAWIGTQMPQGGAVPFIQVGMTYDRVSGDPDRYAAFWSDTAHGFAPQFLMAIHAGNRVSAELSETNDSWVVRFTDLTTHRTRHIRTKQETRGILPQAEWLQEDPGTPTAHVAFAHTVPLTFSDLRVNGTAPQPAGLVPQTMALTRTDLAPTGVWGDQFTIVSRKSDSAPTVATLNPPAEYAGGGGPAPRIGQWLATGRVVTETGYGNNPLAIDPTRVWTIRRRCAGSAGCSYTLTRPVVEPDGSIYQTATLVRTPHGWRVDWPPLTLACSSTTNWEQQEQWYLRISHNGSIAHANESSFSYTPSCGYARSTTTWKATLLRGDH